METTENLEMYVIRDSRGLFYGRGPSWARARRWKTKLTQAKVYPRLGPAKQAISLMAELDKKTDVAVVALQVRLES